MTTDEGKEMLDRKFNEKFKTFEERLDKKLDEKFIALDKKLDILIATMNEKFNMQDAKREAFLERVDAILRKRETDVIKSISAVIAIATFIIIASRHIGH